MSNQPITPGPIVDHTATPSLKEKTAWSMDGFMAIGVIVALIALAGLSLWLGTPAPTSAWETDPTPTTPAILAAAVCILIAVALSSSVVVIQPNQTRVVQLFGKYVGTVHRQGLVATLPFTSRRAVSLRVNNFETQQLKVNDAEGNPVELAAIIVWQVANPAAACFAVQDYTSFVRTQAEAALRHVATTHPYDDADGRHATSLRGSTAQVSEEMAQEVAHLVAVAGVRILEVRISHLAYSPEIAQAMLQRQQANAIVAARSRIVEGAVGMVQMALSKLDEEDIVELDDERKAAMVSNLLVVLCGEKNTTPVINTGSLYT